ncbi:MAG: UbiD family decarboxylase [Fervidicoccus fontis]
MKDLEQLLLINKLRESENIREYNDREYNEEFEIPLLIKKNQGSSTVLFRASRTPFPIISNLFETREKFLKVFGFKNLEDFYRLVTDLKPEKDPYVEFDFDKYYEKSNYGLSKLGALKYYEKDGGFYFTSTIFIAKTELSYNASIHRTMVIDDYSAVARIVPRHLYRITENNKSLGKDTKVTILLGAHPIIELVSSISPPYNQFEFELIPNLLGKKLPIVKSPLWNNPVPLGTSIIIEATITNEMVNEGPFVDIMGTYDRIRKQPLIKINGIYTLKEKPIAVHAILPGGGEHQLLMGITKEAQIYKAVSLVVPKVHKVRLTQAGGGWLHAAISIDKNHDGDGKNAILAAFGAHPSLKHVVVVDGDVDIDDPNMIEWAIATRFQADIGLIVVKNARGSTLDPSANDGISAKMGIDATKPLNGSFIFERAKIPGEM